jgi:catalase
LSKTAANNSLFVRSFIHTQKRNPATHLKDPDAFWDFIGLRPETTHQVSFLFSDRGTPDGYRFMNGYGSHTFKNVNDAGEAVYVKYHFKTDQGIRNLDAAVAERLAADDPDYATRDLYNAIARGEYPSWTMYVQVMTFQQAAEATFNPFDLTKVWSHGDYPLHEVGRLYLNQNPVDYFVQVEQLAFSPSHLIPGIEPSPDKMLQARLFSYPDTHRHRLGANYQQIPCNSHAPTLLNGVTQCPYATANYSTLRTGHYQRDGPMQMTLNGAGAPNYFPNSFQGPAPAAVAGKWHSDTVSTGQIARVETGDEDNFTQVGNFFRRILTADERERLTDNIAGHLHQAQPFIRKRVIQNLAAADASYGEMVADKVAAILAKKQGQQPKSLQDRRPAPLNPPRIIPAPLPDRPVTRVTCPHGYSSKL